MIFKFLKYLQPTNYFSIPNEKGFYPFPDPNDLPDDVISKLEPDHEYEDYESTIYDLAWQALYKGYVGNSEKLKAVKHVPLIDNYRFSRKNFNKAWVNYILFIRLIGLNNPFREIKAWYKTRKTRKISFQESVFFNLEDDRSFSEFLNSKPKVSVVIPTLNRYDYLKDVLKDLENQTYKNFEVIVVDQSDLFKAEFYSKYKLDLHVIKQEEKALWKARNRAIKEAQGTLIALSEDDVRIKNEWLIEHLKCLNYFSCNISVGVFYPEGGQIPSERSFYMTSAQFATGNSMLYKDVFKEVGLFDRQFEKQRMGDGEFGMRCYMKGIRSISNPYASCVDLKASTGGLRHFGSWDAFRTKKWFAPKPIPSVLYFYRTYFGNILTKWALLRTVPISMIPYRFKTKKPMMLIGVIIFIVLTPLVIFQVMRSWRLANEKLKNGPMIEKLA